MRKVRAGMVSEFFNKILYKLPAEKHVFPPAEAVDNPDAAVADAAGAELLGVPAGSHRSWPSASRCPTGASPSSAAW